MSAVGIGEVVRIRITSNDAEEVADFGDALRSDVDLADVLTPMPDLPAAEHGDFGTWELIQEFIVSGIGGATSVGIVEAIRSLWKRKASTEPFPPAPELSPPTAPGQTPQSESITVTAPADGVTEIVVKLRRE